MVGSWYVGVIRGWCFCFPAGMDKQCVWSQCGVSVESVWRHSDSAGA